MITPFSFLHRPARAVVLLSGAGSNAAALLRYERTAAACPYRIVALGTDAPERSRARGLAAEFGLPCFECDLRGFYAGHGESSTRLDTPRRRELRDAWSARLHDAVAAHEPDFVLFAGFVPLTNIAEKLPCLNVHPGDLTREDASGRRLYAGLHLLPVENALLAGERFLRSSVILAQPYSGDGSDEMDAGPVLGVSAPLAVQTGAWSIAELRKIRAARTPGVRPDDPLRELAEAHLERLKTAGDHVVFPRAAADFAAGYFACDDETRQLFYRDRPVVSVEYSADRAAPLEGAFATRCFS